MVHAQRRGRNGRSFPLKSITCVGGGSLRFLDAVEEEAAAPEGCLRGAVDCIRGRCADVLRWDGAENGHSAGQAAAAEPPRTLNWLQLAGITFFAVSGGPFGFEMVVNGMGAWPTVAALLIAIFVWEIPIALMTAELSALLPENGGHVVWVDAAFGPFVSWMNSMAAFLLNFFDNAIYPVMFMDYLRQMVYGQDGQGGDFPAAARWALKALVVAFCTGINIAGVDRAGDLSVAMGVLVMLPFVGVVALAVPRLGRLASAPPRRPNNYDFGSAIGIICWNTSGFCSAGACAGDVKRPSDFGAAMWLAVVLVTLTYLLPTLAGLTVEPDADRWVDGSWVDIAHALGGPWLSSWVGLAACLGSVAMLVSLTCTVSRLMYGMGRVGALPAWFSQLHPRYSTPVNSILVNAAFTLALSALTFEQLAVVDAILYNASLVLRFASVCVLRRKLPHQPRPYRIPLDGFWLAAFFAPGIAICIGLVFLVSWPCLVITLGWLAISSMAYLWMRRNSSAKGAHAYSQLRNDAELAGAFHDATQVATASSGPGPGSGTAETG